MKKVLRKTFSLFIQGFLALLPLIVSINVILFAFSFVEGAAEQVLLLLPTQLSRMQSVRILMQLLSVGTLFFLVALFGIMIRTYVGSAFLKWIDGFFKKVPGLNTIYFSTKQVIDVFHSGKTKFFTHPVLAEYPSPGIWSIGFNTGELTQNELCAIDSVKRFTVFIPTTPNPTSGFLAVLPEDKIRELNITVEDAIKMILTGGMVKREKTSFYVPGKTRPAEPSFNQE